MPNRVRRVNWSSVLYFRSRARNRLPSTSEIKPPSPFRASLFDSAGLKTIARMLARSIDEVPSGVWSDRNFSSRSDKFARQRVAVAQDDGILCFAVIEDPVEQPGAHRRTRRIG